MPRSESVEREVERGVADSLRRLLGGERRVLLAVSGGPDSVCLLAAVAACAPALGLHVEVAWVDHGLRRESAEEGALVARLAARHGLAFHARAVEVGHAAGLEARARALREQALEAVRVGRELEVIATGHTASDQAETLLMRLARGSSLRGAAGVLARRGRLIRPLLGLTRAQVEAYLASRGLPSVTDAMNADPTFLRVRMRTRVLPALEAAAGPGVTERLARFAAYAEEDARWLEAEAEEAFVRLTLQPGHLDAVGTRALERPLRRRVVARLLAGAGLEVDAPLLEAALEALARGGRTGVGRGWVLESAGGRLRLAPVRARRARVPALPLAGPGSEALHPALAWRLGWSAEEPVHVPLRCPLPPQVASPLQVRARQPGDRMLHARGHTRALQDVLVDARVPREQRDVLPIVVDAAGRVLWVPGVAAGVHGTGGGWLWASPAPSPSDVGTTPL